MKCRFLNSAIRSASVVFILLFLFISNTSAQQKKDLTRWVNPFIGTGAHGHTFPGATRPFGMVQLSPDTRIDNWDGASGYHYSDDIIYGFSHLHLSGTGIPDGADILIRPSNEWPIKTKFTKFSHDDETAEPGYYSVKLEDGIVAEMTATTRVGLHRYSLPKPEMAFLTIDLSWRDILLESDFTLVNPTRINGFRRSSSWAKDQKVYFVIEFSSPYEMLGVTVTDKKTSKTPMKTGTKLGFKLDDKEKLLVKVGISHVSIEGARKNLEAELPHWDFDKVRAEAKEEWNKELGKIEVSGGTDEQTTNFYTALYHTMIHPNIFNDVDEKYRGHDGKIHSLWNADALVRNEGRFGPKDPRNTQTSGKSNISSPEEPAIADEGVRVPSEQYTVFSLWDTFRAAHPLYTIIDERRTVDFINTFIRQYEQGGRLPVWELWGEETDTMIGYHAVSVIADAMAKGIKGFDYEKAYAAAKHSAELDHFGLAGYKKRGFISSEDENESVSKTLEYAYNDWCIAQMAKILMDRFRKNSKPEDFYEAFLKSNTKTRFYREFYVKQQDYERYSARARYYENLFDSATGFFRPKKNGGFIEPFAPNEVTFHFTEGNSWQYSFFVPHDVPRLIELMGGREKFAAKLDELFTTDQKLTGRFQPDITGLIGQYAHGNEPSHHAAYLFNYAGQPWKTQMYVRRIMDEFYKNTPEGLIGNEDAGQMSAWFVLSASGFYPIAPGSPIYEIGTPLFKEIKYHLENCKTFTIKAADISDKNIYVKSIKLNGKPVIKGNFGNGKPIYDWQLAHKDIMAGGTLEFEMTSTRPTDLSISQADGFVPVRIFDSFVAVPTINGERSFRETNKITMAALSPDFKVHYTTDGSEPSSGSAVYDRPFEIEKSTTIKAVAVNKRGDSSHIVEAFFLKRENDWTVSVPSGYSTQYTGGGDNATVDGIRGTVNFSSGEWQGVQGKPYEAIIDLKRETTVSEIGGGFLQSVGSWIWMPQRIEFSASDDGNNYKVITEIKPEFPLQTPDKAVRDFTQKITPLRTRYIKIRAFNFGKIPQWHLGAGGDPWIFIDEVIIK